MKENQRGVMQPMGQLNLQGTNPLPSGPGCQGAKLGKVITAALPHEAPQGDASLKTNGRMKQDQASCPASTLGQG